METTVTLDREVYELTAALAQARGITVSAALGELVRRAKAAPEATGADHGPSTARLEKGPDGYLIIAGIGKPVTPQMVKEISEDWIG